MRARRLRRSSPVPACTTTQTNSLLPSACDRTGRSMPFTPDSDLVLLFSADRIPTIVRTLLPTNVHVWLPLQSLYRCNRLLTIFADASTSLY